MLKKLIGISMKAKIISLISTGIILAGIGAGAVIFVNGNVGEKPLNTGSIETMAAQWPENFSCEEYIEPEFIDDENRDNNAFNVADFGEQGSNGWFYRYGDVDEPSKSKQIEMYDEERYYQVSVDGLEIKKDFVHTGAGVAPILEWRAARQGAVNLKLTYVKNVNGDKNPGFPDGVRIYIYKGDELLETHQVDVQIDEETLLETTIENLEVKDGESIYVVVDPQNNNAYDGGLLYVAIADVNAKQNTIKQDNSRKDNNANNVKDYGAQGENGWYYMYGKDVKHCELVSSETTDGYINNTSPGLVISKEFIHPAINDNAILSWKPQTDGVIELRGKYTKFEQNDGNPEWPDGVTVQVYLNEQKLFEKKVEAPDKGTKTIEFREEKIKVTSKDRLYFVVNANKNSSYDGGCFAISILDRNGMENEESVVIDESEIRQNFASVKDDFGEQGNNGWFFQEGYKDQPFGTYNMKEYIEDDKYMDDSYLEIKRDFVNTGENGKSAVIKWKVAQDGEIKIEASYTKLKNEDKNPSWPDGTRVTLYHNNTELIRQEFAADVSNEVTKSLNVEKLAVKRGDYITMVINGKENNAYDGGKYDFSIYSLSGLVGLTENDVLIENDENRTNNASVIDDFGKQGNNGWFYQYGYYTDPFFAVNIEKYVEGEKYYTKDGIEIKKDFIMPSTKGKSANVKWKVAEDGAIDIYVDYTKLKNEDANPSWPDGTVITLMHNRTVLRCESFEPDTSKEVTKDLSVFNVNVKKGDYITLVVDGKKNTAYDGGLYSFSIEDASRVEIEKKNDSGVNRANLAADFGEQGSNGWYYLEGSTLENAEILTKKTEDNAGYTSRKAKNLEIKKDFVQPRLRKDAMYQWVVAQDGEIDVIGSYVKFGHNDPNVNWPDGTAVRVYLNNTLLQEEKVAVLQGEGNDNVVAIDMEDLEVKKGDILTFSVNALKNNAWDGGRLAIQIKPSAGEIVYNPAPDNETNLFEDFGEQGNEGWYYGYGNTSAEFSPADKNNEEYSYVLQEGLLLKKDGVHPGKDAGAIYRWIVGADGKIDLEGAYYKSRNESVEDNTPDGVKVEVYKNGQLIDGMSYDITVSKTEEIVQQIEKTDFDVNKGDMIDFIIFAKGNAAWDYGKLEMNISDAQKPIIPEETESRTNNTNLCESFGEQGNDGWYYLEGSTLEKAKLLTQKTEDNAGYISKSASGLEIKKDFVQPGALKDAMYQWVVAQDGEVDVVGSYVKFGHNDSNVNWPDGTMVRVYLNNTLLFEEKAAVLQGDGNDNTIKIALKKQNVKKGDIFTFAINALENNAWDGGRLSIQIKPYAGEEITYNPAPDNETNLFRDFGEQGNEGWYYGYGNTSAEFKTADKYNEEYSCALQDGLLLKKDGVHPSKDAGAIYRWIVGADGKINLNGKYYKSRNENAEDNAPDGVKVEVYKNGQLIDGMSYDVAVSKTEEIVQQIEKMDFEVKRGDKIDFIISAKGNAAWDYGKLEMNISDAANPAVPEEPQEPEEPEEPQEPQEPEEPERTNHTNLYESFGEQGNDGWYFGVCEWNGQNFTELTYDPVEERYYNNGKPELKKDFVEPGNGLNAAYKWIAAEDGRIRIQGEYLKYPNADDPYANGVCLRIFQNLAEKKWMGGTIQGGNITSEVLVPIDEVLDVKKGDEIIFAVDPDGNDSWDGGKLSISISSIQ